MTARDPVCGMEVDEATAEWKTDYAGHTYYFCAPGCLWSFQKEPQKYLDDAPSDNMEHDQSPSQRHDPSQTHGHQESDEER